MWIVNMGRYGLVSEWRIRFRVLSVRFSPPPLSLYISLSFWRGQGGVKE